MNIATNTPATKPTVKVQLLEDRFAIIKINPRLAYITETYKKVSYKGNSSRIVVTYIGFGSYASALGFASKLSGKRLQIRPAKRLTGCAYEVKVSGLTVEEIKAIAERLQPVQPVRPVKKKSSILDFDNIIALHSINGQYQELKERYLREDSMSGVEQKVIPLPQKIERN